MQEFQYNRERAVAYARRWAFGRNPDYYAFDNLGGDCTNFASQCLFAGTGAMNFTPTFGWYYRSLNDRAPAWTSVEALHRFLTTNTGAGPYGEDCALEDVKPGDVVQMKFEEGVFVHNPLVVATLGREAPNPGSVLVAAHSYDAYRRALNTYQYIELRPIHILGWRKP
jgi:hypothetical protein